MMMRTQQQPSSRRASSSTSLSRMLLRNAFPIAALLLLVSVLINIRHNLMARRTNLHARTNQNAIMPTSVELPHRIHGDEVSVEQPTVSRSEPNPYLCSISRVRNESEKVSSFIRYYLNQGFTRIILIDDRSSPPLSYQFANSSSVFIIRTDLTLYAQQHLFIREYLNSPLLHDCAWIAQVDVDEFVATRRHPRRTVAQEVALLEARTGANAILIPWIFFSYSSNKQVKYIPHDILWRWNHSKHHYSSVHKTRDRYDVIEHKYLFKPSECYDFNIHSVSCTPPIVESTRGARASSSYAFRRFSEAKLQRAILVIHHYRFTSENNIRSKCSADSVNAYSKLSHEKCVEEMTRSNYREIYDDTMIQKP